MQYSTSVSSLKMRLLRVAVFVTAIILVGQTAGFLIPENAILDRLLREACVKKCSEQHAVCEEICMQPYVTASDTGAEIPDLEAFMKVWGSCSDTCTSKLQSCISACDPLETTTMTQMRLTHGEASAMFANAGIPVWSSSNCKKEYCTNFENIRSATMDAVLSLKSAQPDLKLVVTGGTESGHKSGDKSHKNGYKLDVDDNQELDAYIEANFEYIGSTKAGWKQYKDGSGNTWTYETKPVHWDVLVP